MRTKHDIPTAPAAPAENGSEGEAPLTETPSPSSEPTGDSRHPQTVKGVNTAMEELNQAYARIDEVREEVRILESSLRMKDPMRNTMMRPTPAFKLPKTQLTFEQSKDIYAARQELRQELQTLEGERDRLESELLPEEDAEAMRKARADIEAVPEEDLVFGGEDKIEEPTYGKHVRTRLLESSHLATGNWHAFQSLRRILEKTGLQKPLHALGEWLAKKAEALGKKIDALNAPKDQKALPPGTPETPAAPAPPEAVSKDKPERP